ncbi:MAG TPA: CDP-glucose 4,6-dehydratase [Thermoleophilia bacterium]|nr:CDP-glucose 4,6-dehydratase [Thermoleophilia bacterium]
MMFGGSYGGRRVFVTGHTGFKGSWLTLWLLELGAEVTGYALEPPTVPNLFEAAGLGDVGRGLVDVRADVRDLQALSRVLQECAPDIVFHLAAQPLVRRSYEQPRLTYETNVMGTVNLLEAVRLSRAQGRRVAVVNVTSDKCYDNPETGLACVEDDPLGGFDPYSSSKACSELITSSYARSYFGARGDRAVASARAGNVIGGGDWAEERILPDCVRALSEGEPVVVRNPQATRPWQHVLESLAGYLSLGAALWRGDPAAAPPAGRGGHAWNFGPSPESHVTVRTVVDLFVAAWGAGEWVAGDATGAPHEAGMLSLDSEKAKAGLGWRPAWTVREAVESTALWYRRYYGSAYAADVASLCRADIAAYSDAARRAGAAWAVAGGAS